jgi:hypothetical protein
MIWVRIGYGWEWVWIGYGSGSDWVWLGMGSDWVRIGYGLWVCNNLFLEQQLPGAQGEQPHQPQDEPDDYQGDRYRYIHIWVCHLMHTYCEMGSGLPAFPLVIWNP